MLQEKYSDTAKKTSEGEVQKAYVVSENSVVFLSIPQSEYDALPEYAKYEYTEIIDDFASYVNKVEKILKQNGLKPRYANSKKLIFKYAGGKEKRRYFDTKEYPVAFALFGRGKEPRIYYGIVQDYDILKTVGEYFGIDLTKEQS